MSALWSSTSRMGVAMQLASCRARMSWMDLEVAIADALHPHAGSMKRTPTGDLPASAPVATRPAVCSKLCRARLWYGDADGAHLLQVPADERIHVVFLARGQRSGLVADRIHASLLPRADLPVLLVRELPERQHLLEVVVLAFDRILAHQPIAAYLRNARAARQETRGHRVIATRVHPEVRHAAQAQHADIRVG